MAVTYACGTRRKPEIGGVCWQGSTRHHRCSEPEDHDGDHECSCGHTWEADEDG